jgi:hypothetical protein
MAENMRTERVSDRRNADRGSMTQEKRTKSRRIHTILLAGALPVALVGGASAAGVALSSGTAFAATKGSCTPLKTLTPIEKFQNKLTWGALSTGWSPSGTLHMKLVLTINGSSGTVNASTSGTHISYGPNETTVPSTATVSLAVTVSGPAGTVSCRA